MTDNDKASQLRELLKQQFAHFAQTRLIEWRVNLAVWSTLVSAAAFLVARGVRLRDRQHFIIYIATAFVITLVHSVCWMIPIQYSEDTDDHYINAYRREIEKLCGFAPEKRQLGCFWEAYRCFRVGGLSWILGETGITMVILLLIGLVFRFAP